MWGCDMSIKYFCDVTGQELDLDYCLHENDKLEHKHATIFTNGVIQRVGHGGIFDRIDSLMFVVIFANVLYYFKLFP